MATNQVTRLIHSSRSGFTLLEILLVSVLLFFLAIATFSSVKSIVDTKFEIDYRTEFLQLSRATVALLDRDLRAAFYLVPEDLGWAPRKPDPNATPPILPAVKSQPVTIFVGSAERLFFSAKSHQRMAADSPENDQHFVSYELQSGNIVRAESKRAVALTDRDNADKFQQFTLLEGVKKVKFRFWSRQQGRWVDEWDTEKSDFKDILPVAVEVFIEFEPKMPEGSKIKKVQLVRINTIVKISEASLKSDRLTDEQSSSLASSSSSASSGSSP